MYGDRTVWHGFLSYMRKNKQHIATSPGFWTQATELMIEHEAEEFPTAGVFLREMFDAETAKRLDKMLAQRDGEPDKQQPSVETAKDIFSGTRHIFTWVRWFER
jgi:hypothetical protein